VRLGGMRLETRIRSEESAEWKAGEDEGPLTRAKRQAATSRAHDGGRERDAWRNAECGSVKRQVQALSSRICRQYRRPRTETERALELELKSKSKLSQRHAVA
jgi:hypothetical protein